MQGVLSGVRAGLGFTWERAAETELNTFPPLRRNCMAEGKYAQAGDTFCVFSNGTWRILSSDITSLLFWVSKTHGVQADLNKHTLIKRWKRCEEPQQQLLQAPAAVTQSEFLQQLQPSVLSPYSARSAICAKGIFGPTGTIKDIFPETVILLCSGRKTGTACWQAGCERTDTCRNPRLGSMKDFHF